MQILLVEDHTDTRTILSRLLARCGHDISTAANVGEALGLLSGQQFDALVSDIGLPDGNGLQVVVEARKRQPLKTAIAVTALATDADRARGFEAGFDHYLTKPFDFARLRSVLAAA